MALRKPIVMNAGQMQQIQSGDDLDAAASGTTDVSLTNAEAGAVVCGTPVYSFGAGTVKKAKADAAGTSKVVGLMHDASTAGSAAGLVAVAGILALTTGQWDAVTGASGGLTFNNTYYLDPATAGLLTATAPTTVGQSVVAVGRALSTTTMELFVREPILL